MTNVSGRSNEWCELVELIEKSGQERQDTALIDQLKTAASSWRMQLEQASSSSTGTVTVKRGSQIVKYSSSDIAAKAKLAEQDLAAERDAQRRRDEEVREIVGAAKSGQTHKLRRFGIQTPHYALLKSVNAVSNSAAARFDSAIEEKKKRPTSFDFVMEFRSSKEAVAFARSTVLHLMEWRDLAVDGWRIPQAEEPFAVKWRTHRLSAEEIRRFLDTAHNANAVVYPAIEMDGSVYRLADVLTPESACPRPERDVLSTPEECAAATQVARDLIDDGAYRECLYFLIKVFREVIGDSASARLQRLWNLPEKDCMFQHTYCRACRTIIRSPFERGKAKCPRCAAVVNISLLAGPYCVDSLDWLMSRKTLASKSADTEQLPIREARLKSTKQSAGPRESAAIRCAHKNTGESAFYCGDCGQQLRFEAVPDTLRNRYCSENHKQMPDGINWCTICGEWLGPGPERNRQAEKAGAPWEKYARYVDIPVDCADTGRSESMRFQFLFAGPSQAEEILNNLPDKFRIALQSPNLADRNPVDEGPGSEFNFLVWFESVSLTVGEAKELMNRVVEAGGGIYEAFLT